MPDVVIVVAAPAVSTAAQSGAAGG